MVAVDKFVFYDDVNFIKQGWINRNRILLYEEDYLFTLELKGSSSFKKINDIEIGNNRDKLLKTFRQAYIKAPYFREVEPLLKVIFESPEKNLAKFIIESNQLIINYLNINTEFLISSSIEKDNSLKGKLKIIEICRNLGATSYVNAIGGKDLYLESDFINAGLSLKFLQSPHMEYRQFANAFIPWLSIIDVMMFNSVYEISKMLDSYDLI